MRPTQFPERIQREDGKVGLLQMRSDQIRKGLERAPHRSLLYADGMTDEELKSDKPLIAIISSQADIIPGHNHLQRLVNDVKAGIYMAGGIPMQFGTIGVCDGIAMNHEGMKYSLTSREVIADSVECAVQGHAFDGVVLIPSCDKIVPGMIMGALRVNLPTVLVSGGPMLAGRDRDRKTETDLNTLFDGTANASGAIFLDSDDTAPGMVDQQTTIYGHHMNDGSMFNVISDTTDQATFDSIEYVYYITRDATYKLRPLATKVVEDTYAKARIPNFEGDDGLKNYLSEMLDGASAVASDATDRAASATKVVTLVTCRSLSLSNTRAVMVLTPVEE